MFRLSTEDATNNAGDNNKQRVPTSTSSFENREVKKPPADKHSSTSDDTVEEPKLEPQDLLLWALENNKFEKFSSLLRAPEVNPKFKYGKPHFTTCMELACRLQWGGKFVKTLLEHDVRPNVHEINQEPIHYAARYGNPEALEALLQNKKTKVNVVDSAGRTALHHAVRYSQEGREAEYGRCIQLLLKRPDLALNIPNNHGYTAVHEAANFSKKAVELILKHRQDDVDLDSYRTRGRTARECIHSNYPELRPLLQKYQIKYQSMDRHSQLLSALQNRQLDTFHGILCQVDEDGKARVDPNYCYERPHFATCLEIACREKDCAEFIKELLRAGADPNFVNPKTKQTALHVAVDVQNIHALTVLLKDKRTNINPLHGEVKKVIYELGKKTRNDKTMQDGEETRQYKDALQELESILNSRTSEIQNTLPRNTNIDGSELFQHLYCGKGEEFKKKFTKACKDFDDGYYTLLQCATLHRLEDIVQLLLKSGADPNATAKHEKQPPILIACRNSDQEIIKLFLSSETDIKLNVNVTDAKGNTPLHYVSHTGYLDCVVGLMRCGADIKHKNIFDKPPLPANSVKNFLDKSLQTNGIPPQNEEYEIIFDYSFLVTHKEKDTQPNLPQEGDQPLTNDHELGSRDVHFPEKLNPEMDFLFYISHSNEHRKLMKHPIITSFLHMKWERVKLYFYINICLYFIFAILLNSYIILQIGHSATNGTATNGSAMNGSATNGSATNGSESGITSNDTKTTQSIMTSCGFHAVWYAILIFLIYFTVRELLQLALSPKVYFTNYENILDFSIIFFSGYILLWSEWQESFVVITIMLSWTELILLTGRLPKLSKNIEMLKTVSLNYFWFLFSYIFLLIAFAFSFYSLLHSDMNRNGTENQYFFLNPYMSVMKTFVMMMGEFDADSMPSEKANSITFFILFALFVFIIAMVLLNLLTGLAVSDTQTIKSNAEELSIVSRIRLIYEMESTLLRWHIFVEKWPTYTFICPFINSQKSHIKNISLFPDTSYKKRIHVLPNKGPNIVFERNGLSEGEDGDELHKVHVTPALEGSRAQNISNNHTNSKRQNTSCKMSLVIIGEATHIISKRSEPDVNNMKENFCQIQEALKENESKLSKIENKMEENQQLLANCLQKLDALETKLEHDKMQRKTKAFRR
jgi:ankyrin repeat protein